MLHGTPTLPLPERTVQLDLFHARHLALARARRAFASGDLRTALDELRALARRYPGDRIVGEALCRARSLQARLDAIERLGGRERREALLALARRFDEPGARGEFRRSLLRRLAADLLTEGGPSALHRGRPAGSYWIEAGDLDAATVVLESAVRRVRRPRFLALLADADALRGNPGRAKPLYREALGVDPYDVLWSSVRDPEVRSLPAYAEDELELPDPIAWAAPVGAVLGVLPARAPLPQPAAEGGELSRAQRFLGALVRASAGPREATLDARRTMKRLSPALFAAYLSTI